MRVVGSYGAKIVPLPDLAKAYFKASVGNTGPNKKADVRLIQTMLNSAARGAGIPIAPLAVDGICGPLTQAAIKAYQLFRFDYSDGHIDPGQATIRWLAMDAKAGTIGGEPLPILAPKAQSGVRMGFAGGAPQAVGAPGDPSDPDWDPWAGGTLPEPIKANTKEDLRANRAFQTIPAARHAAAIAIKVLDLAVAYIRESAAGPVPVNVEQKKRAFALVVKHFCSKAQGNDSASILAASGVIRQVFVNVCGHLIQRAKFWDRRGYFIGIDQLENGETAIMEAKPGGVWLRDPRIWCGPLLDSKVPHPEGWAETIVHECAHYVGPARDSKTGAIEDLYANDPNYADAHTNRRSWVATPYGLLAGEATYGTKGIKFHIDVKNEFDRPPILDKGFFA